MRIENDNFATTKKHEIFLKEMIVFFLFLIDRRESAEGFEDGVGGFNGDSRLRLFHFVLRRRHGCRGCRQRLAGSIRVQVGDEASLFGEELDGRVGVDGDGAARHEVLGDGAIRTRHRHHTRGESGHGGDVIGQNAEGAAQRRNVDLLHRLARVKGGVWGSKD